MGFYIAIWFFLLFCSVFIKGKRGIDNWLFWATFLFLVFIAGGRTENVGVDTPTYESVYRAVQSEGYIPYLEPGWNLLNIVCGNLSLSFNVFLTVISVLTLFPVFYVAKKESPNPFFTVFAYYAMHMYCGSFNISRQYLALSEIFLAYYFFSHQKSIWTFLSVAIAICIHYSSIFCIVSFLFARYVKLNNTKICGLLLASFLIGSLMNDSLLGYFALIYDSYVNPEVYRESSVIAYLFTIMMNVFAILVVYTASGSAYSNKWFILYVLSVIILNLTFKLHYGTRIYVIFAISQLLFFPLHVRNCRIQYKKVMLFLFLLYLSLNFFRITLVNGNQIFPYHNYWLN